MPPVEFRVPLAAHPSLIQIKDRGFLYFPICSRDVRELSFAQIRGNRKRRAKTKTAEDIPAIFEIRFRSVPTGRKVLRLALFRDRKGQFASCRKLHITFLGSNEDPGIVTSNPAMQIDT